MAGLMKFHNARPLEQPCKWMLLDKALRLAEDEQKRGSRISENLAYHLVNECSKLKHIEFARRTQSLLVYSRLDSVAILADHLIRIFASCGILDEANQAFSRVREPSQYTWNAIIAAHVKLKQCEAALQLYQKMQEEGTKPDKYTFLSILKGLSILKSCDRVGAKKQVEYVCKQIFECGLQSNGMVGSALVDIYAKFGDLEEARRIFDKLPDRDVVTWSVMISGYAHLGEIRLAIKCFDDMQANGIMPNAVTWNALIAGFIQHGNTALAFKCFESMQDEGIKPIRLTFLSILKACSSIRDIYQGRSIHNYIVDHQIDSGIILGSTLIDMYAKCGHLEEARIIFDTLPDRNVVTWGAMIAGYVQNGKGFSALDCFSSMCQEQIRPDEVVLSSTLKACGCICALWHGRKIHEQFVETGIQRNIVLVNTLVDMYAKCSSLEEASNVFHKLSNRDAVTWSTMISGYAQMGKGLLALECFSNMQQEGIKPSKITFLSILKACGSLAAKEQGNCIHEQIIERGFQNDTAVANALVDMYAKFGNLKKARKIFDKLPERNIITWGAMIAGYAQHGECLVALECFASMQNDGIHPNIVTWGAVIAGFAEHGEGLAAITCFENMQENDIRPNKAIFLNILKASGSIGAMELGRDIHHQAFESGLQCDLDVASCLVDMYSKCGNLEEASLVFDSMLGRDVVSWNAMITGSAQLADAGITVLLFKDMQRCGIRPDEISFTGILTACCRVGLVDEGCWYLRSMKEDHGISPCTFHISCMMDLLGRGGHFEEVKAVLEVVKQRDIHLWITLLSACRMHGNVELGRKCFDEIVHLDSDCAAAYVLMSNTYAYTHADGGNKAQSLRKYVGALLLKAKCFGLLLDMEIV